MSDIKVLDFDESEVVYVEFEMLVDMDYGLIRFIADKFADEDMFYTDVLFKEEKLLKGMLMERRYYNPLTVPAIDEDNIELLDKLYDQFFERYHDEILDYSVFTNVMEAIIKYIVMSSVKVQFICDYTSEAKVLYDILNKFNIHTSAYSIFIREDKNSIIDVSKCNIFVAKYATNLYRYSGLDTKNIYLADLVCNLDQEKLEEKNIRYPNIDSILYYSENQINYMQLYPYDEDYAVNGIFWYEIEAEEESKEYEKDSKGYIIFNPSEYEMSNSDVNMLKEWMSPEQFNKNFGGNDHE